jgi:hypothetical protein
MALLRKPSIDRLYSYIQPGSTPHFGDQPYPDTLVELESNLDELFIRERWTGFCRQYEVADGISTGRILRPA